MLRPRHTLRLAGLLAALLLLPASPASADAEVTIARLRYGGGGDWYCDPGSLANWLAEFGRRTGVPVADGPVVVGLDSEDLYRYPMLYVSGHGRIALAEDEVAELRRYLDAGGFLYADDNYGLDAAFRAAMDRLFPEAPLELVPADHPIYHSWYKLAGVPKIHEHDGRPPQGWGVFLDGRLAVFYTHEADIGDGMEDAPVHKDPPEKREAAFRMAVNILYYALTRNDR